MMTGKSTVTKTKSIVKEYRRQEVFQDWNDFKNKIKNLYRLDQAIMDFTGIHLRRTGQELTGCCPFHDDKKPSMSVNSEKGYYYCHAAGCGASGDIFTFISEYTDMGFCRSVLEAAARVGIEPPSGINLSMPVIKGGEKNKRRPVQNETNPANLLESDLVPAFKNSRMPRNGEFFPVWKPTDERFPNGCLKKYKPEMHHLYRDIDNIPLMVILRCRLYPRDKKSGGKYFIPLRIGKLPEHAPEYVVDERDTRMGWHVKGTTGGHRKPLYGMERALNWFAANGRHILIVEGEKTADAAQRLLSQIDNADDWLILSPMGGHNASLYADWTEFMKKLAETDFSGLTFLVWPDADHVMTRPDGSQIDIQALYVRDSIGAFYTAMRKQGLDPTLVKFIRACPGTQRKSGWDLADAEHEDWTGADVIRDIDEKGMSMSVEKRFTNLNVSESGFFEDGPETNIDFPDDDLSNMETDSNETAAVITPLFGQEAEKQVEDDIETIDPDSEIINDGDDNLPTGPSAVRERNSYFRVLGFRECTAYFMSLRGGEIYSMPIAGMRRQAMLGLAPLRFWEYAFAVPDRNGRLIINWDEAMSAVIEAAYDNGVWDPRKKAGQGARIDLGRVVFNSGGHLWIQSEPDGKGVISSPAEYNGEYQYIIGDDCGLPDFDNAWQTGDTEPRELLELIRKLDWREGSAKTSIMSLFGWICIGPICGVLPWRPHIWLHGKRASGKSWIMENIIQPSQGEYVVHVKSNTSESGLRHVLDGQARPLMFDEAETENDSDRKRMNAILQLARHSATPGNSMVVQGVPGGNGRRFFSIASSFLLSSIMPHLVASADKTRFAHARLGDGHKLDYFAKHVETRAAELLTPDFSSRLIARMIMRAGSIRQVSKLMIRGLTALNIERRLADVWGTYAAGAWCLLEDGIPEDYSEALNWIEEVFDIKEEIIDMAAEIGDDTDHARLFRHLMAYELRCETVHLGTRNFNIGSILRMAIFESQEGDLEREQAEKRLMQIGIRLGHNQAVAKQDQKIDCLIIHRNSPRISEILSQTPYASSYVDVIQQARNVIKGQVVHFGGLGKYRSVIVPLEHFPVLGEEEEKADDSKGTKGHG